MIDRLMHPLVVVCVLWGLAVATPLLGILHARFLLGARHRRRALRRPLFWVLSGSGPLLVLLWYVFNGINAGMGLDSFAGLILNVLLFALVGAGLGATLRFLPRGRSENSSAPPPEM